MRSVPGSNPSTGVDEPPKICLECSLDGRRDDAAVSNPTTAPEECGHLGRKLNVFFVVLPLQSRHYSAHRSRHPRPALQLDGVRNGPTSRCPAQGEISNLAQRW